jgi:ribosomal protein L19E
MSSANKKGNKEISVTLNGKEVQEHEQDDLDPREKTIDDPAYKEQIAIYKNQGGEDADAADDDYCNIDTKEISNIEATINDDTINDDTNIEIDISPNTNIGTTINGDSITEKTNFDTTIHDDIGNNKILLEPMDEVEDLHDTTTIAEEVEDLHDTTNIEPEPPPTTSRSGRNTKSNSKYQEHQEKQRKRRDRAKYRQHKKAFHISVNEGLNKNKLSTIKVMFNEVMQINSKSVWIPKTARLLTRSQMKKSYKTFLL